MTGLDRYIFRLMLVRLVQLGTAVFLFMMLERALRLIHEMTAGGMHLRHFPALLIELVPYYINLALPGAFALALVIGALALSDNREIEAMAGFGLPLRRLVRPMVALGSLVAAASLLLGGWLEPLGRYDFRVEQAIARSSSTVSTYQPPAILRLGGNLVFSAERADGEGLAGLFFWARDAQGRETVITSGHGAIVADVQADRLQFTFRQGQVLRVSESGQDAGPMQFDRLVLNQPLSGGGTLWARGKDANELTLGELLGRPPEGAEPVGWYERQAAALARLARSLSVPFLPLLVLPLVLGAPAGRRGPNLVLIAASLMLFHHGINFAKNLGSAGEAHPAVAVLAVIAPFAALVGLVWVAGRGLPGPAHLSLGTGLHSERWPAAGTTARQLSAAPSMVTGLTAYLQRHVWIGSLTALAVTVALLLLVELIEQGDDLVRLGAGFGGTVRFAAHRVPVLAQQLLPMATLAGGVLAFLALRRSRELLAMQLNGMSAFGILRRTAPVALALGVIGMVLSELVLPASQTAFARWWQELEQKGAPPASASPRWFRAGSEIVRVDAIGPDGREMTAPVLYRRDPQGMLSAIVSAQSASHQPGHWVFSTVETVSVSNGIQRSSHTPEMAWSGPLTPVTARRLAADFPGLSAAEARDAALGGISTSFGAPFYRTRAMDMPLQLMTPLVMLVLAMPVVFASLQNRREVWTVYLVAVAGLLFMVVDGCLKIAGHLGLMAPWQAVSSAPLLFLLAGLTWLLRSEKVS